MKILKDNVLKEMPYIDLENSNKYKNLILDLGFEKLTNKGIIDEITNILNGKIFIDLYSNKLQLSTYQDKVDFVDALNDNYQFKTTITARFSCHEQELLDILIHKSIYS